MFLTIKVQGPGMIKKASMLFKGLQPADMLVVYTYYLQGPQGARRRPNSLEFTIIDGADTR